MNHHPLPGGMLELFDEDEAALCRLVHSLAVLHAFVPAAVLCQYGHPDWWASRMTYKNGQGGTSGSGSGGGVPPLLPSSSLPLAAGGGLLPQQLQPVAPDGSGAANAAGGGGHGSWPLGGRMLLVAAGTYWGKNNNGHSSPPQLQPCSPGEPQAPASGCAPWVANYAYASAAVAGSAGSALAGAPPAGSSLQSLQTSYPQCAVDILCRKQSAVFPPQQAADGNGLLRVQGSLAPNTQEQHRCLDLLFDVQLLELLLHQASSFRTQQVGPNGGGTKQGAALMAGSANALKLERIRPEVILDLIARPQHNQHNVFGSSDALGGPRWSLANAEVHEGFKAQALQRLARHMMR
jgi:hypothetical protein